MGPLCKTCGPMSAHWVAGWVVGFLNCSMFCSALLCVHSNPAIILMGKRELVSLLVFLVSRDCCVVDPHDATDLPIVVLPDHTHF